MCWRRAAASGVAIGDDVRRDDSPRYDADEPVIVTCAAVAIAAASADLCVASSSA